MTRRKITGRIHLWLGLSSGILVFIIAVTGCIYAFQAEIQELTQPYRHVPAQEQASFLPPSRLRAIADAQLPGKKAHSVLYAGRQDAAKVIYFSFEEDYYYFVYLNPYNGQVLKVKNEETDFFRLVLDGHFYLWLPPDIGQPVAASATLVFVALLISGIIMWWPRNASGARQRFTIKWDARWRRKNYDLHNVLGFYCSLIALFLALTGLVWGFQWFASGVYGLASGGKELLPYEEPLSAKPYPSQQAGLLPIDQVWIKTKAEHPEAQTIEVHFPVDANTSILAAINPDAATYWQIDYRYFDQYSLKELPVKHMWGRSQQASGADKLMRMNYDLHTGAIIGLPGKLLAFFASLLVASLPVTGFLVWWGRRKKEKRVTKKAEHYVPAQIVISQ